MKKKLYSLFTLSLLSLLTHVGTVKPYVFKVDVWSDGRQNLYCLNDYHDETQYVDQQRADLLSTAKDLNAFVVAEDMSEYSRNNPVCKQWISAGKKDNRQLLLYLTSACKQQGIDAENVEFRNETTISASGGKISAAEALETADSVEQEVKSYDDGSVFNSFYQNYLDLYGREIGNPAKAWFSSYKSSTDCLRKVAEELPYPTFMNNLLEPSELKAYSTQQQKELVFKLFNSYLVEPRIVHAIATHPQYKSIIVCAGAAHVYRIQPALEQAGFKLVDSITGDIASPDKNAPDMVNIKDTFTSLIDSNPELEIISSQSPEQSNYLALLLLAALALIAVAIGYRKRRVALLLLFALLSGITNIVKPYIHRIDAWSDGKQNVYCLSDGHYPTHLSIDQTKQFTDFVKEKNGSVIVEDILDYNGSSAETKRALTNFNQPELHFLPGLTATCKQNRIPVNNVEFRQLSFASRSGYNVSSKDVYDRSEQTKKDASRYHDSNPFDSCYHDYFKKVESVQKQCEPYIKQVRNSTEPLQALIPKTDYPETLDNLIGQFRGTLQTDLDLKKRDVIKVYDAALVDVRILHELARNTNKNMFICAGGWHIDQLESSFNKLGYTKLHSVEGAQPIDSKPQFPYGVSIKDAFKELDKSVDNITVNNSSTVPQQSSYLPLLLLIGLALIAVVFGYRKRKLALLIPFALLSGITNIVKPYVYQVDIWSNGKQNLYCLSDEHYPAQASVQQKEQLLKQAKATNAAVIVEDMLTYEGNDPEIDKLIAAYHDGPYHFLLNLTQECQEDNIPVTNVEFRHASNASLAGLNKTAKEVFDLDEQVKQEVKNYADGPAFKTCYQEYLDELEQLQDSCEPFVKQLRNKEQKLYNLLPTTRYNRALDKLLENDIGYLAPTKDERKNDLITMYDAALIDMRILHSIAQHPDKPLFICAGGWHIQHLEDAFKQLGYRCVQSTDGTIAVDGAQEDCLPKAVELDEFFKTTPAEQPLHTKDTTHTGVVLLLVILALFILIMRSRIGHVLKRRALLLLLLGLPALVDAHIYRIEKWTDETEKHNIFTFHDFHTSRFTDNQKTQQQRADIVKTGQERGAGVIVEDMYLDLDKLVKNPIAYDPHSVRTLRDKELPSNKTTPLIALTPACKDGSLPVVNVEFRHTGLLSYAGKAGISAHDCLRATERARKKVARFNDNSILNDFYKAILERHAQLLEEGKPFFDQIRSAGDATVEDLFENNKIAYSPAIDTALKTFGWTERRLESAPVKQKIEALFHYYDVGLVDAHIAHALHTYKDKANTFVCAGFKHIENIEDILNNLGYNKVGYEGKGLLEGNNTMEPDALDIAEAMKNLDPHPIREASSSNLLILFAVIAVLLGLAVRNRRRQRKIIR